MISTRVYRYTACPLWLMPAILVVLIFYFYKDNTIERDLLAVSGEKRAYEERVVERSHAGVGSRGFSNAKVVALTTKFVKTCDVRKALPVSGLPNLKYEQALKELIRRDGEPGWNQVDCPRKPQASPFNLRRVVALMSFPGSGNTWFRHLLQQLTGIIAGDLKDIYRQQNVLTIKTHEAALWNQGARIFERIVLLIRNPYDANVAEYKRGFLSLGKTGDQVIDPDSPKWNHYAWKRMLKYWPFFLRVALVHEEPIHFVFYEDAVKNLLPELLSVAVFLNTTHVDEFSFCCAVVEREGANHRNATIKDNSYLFSEDLRKAMNALLRSLANDYKARYPILSRKLLEYQLL